MVGFYPQPHRVLACAKYLNVADAGRARDRIRDVDVCVVRQKVRVVRPMRRVQGKQHERSGYRLSDSNSVVVDIGGELRGSLRLARLRKNQICIRIGLYVEVHDQGRVRVARGVQRIHIVHVVHAAHLLFDWSGDRLLQRLGVGANVRGQDLNFRRSDVGELRDRQTEDRDGAYYHHNDRNHHRDDGAVDKKL